MKCDPQAILALVKAGHTNAQIAQQLRVSTRTLDRYRVADPDLNRAILDVRTTNNFWSTPAPCGTVGAYNRHRRRGEPIDHACRHANALAARSHRLRSGPVDTTRGRPRLYPDTPPSEPTGPVQEGNDLPTRIELAIARGLPTARIMTELAVDYPTVKNVRDRMSA